MERRHGEKIEEAESKDLFNAYLLAERLVLHTLCFDLAITHPYTACFHKQRGLKHYIAEAERQEFHQAAVNFCNDSFFTPLCLQYPAATIAAAAVFLATSQMGIAPQKALPPKPSGRGSAPVPPSDPTWYDLVCDGLAISERQFKSICEAIMGVYQVR